VFWAEDFFTHNIFSSNKPQARFAFGGDFGRIIPQLSLFWDIASFEFLDKSGKTFLLLLKIFVKIFDFEK